jgi:hypothetical protein
MLVDICKAIEPKSTDFKAAKKGLESFLKTEVRVHFWQGNPLNSWIAWGKGDGGS